METEFATDMDQSQDEMRDVVKRLRKRYAMTQIELAKRSEIPQATLSRWEGGHIDIPEGQLRKIASSIDAYEEEQQQRAKSGDPWALIESLAGKAERGKAIASLRSMHSITQTELAMKADLSRSSLSLFETGYAALSEEDEERLKNVLKLLISERQRAGSSVNAGNMLQLLASYNKSEEQIAAEHTNKLLADPYFLLETTNDTGKRLFDRCKELSKENAKLSKENASFKESMARMDELISLLLAKIERQSVRDKGIADQQQDQDTRITELVNVRIAEIERENAGLKAENEALRMNLEEQKSK